MADTVCHARAGPDRPEMFEDALSSFQGGDVGSNVEFRGKKSRSLELGADVYE